MKFNDLNKNNFQFKVTSQFVCIIRPVISLWNYILPYVCDPSDNLSERCVQVEIEALITIQSCVREAIVYDSRERAGTAM